MNDLGGLGNFNILFLQAINGFNEEGGSNDEESEVQPPKSKKIRVNIEPIITTKKYKWRQFKPITEITDITTIDQLLDLAWYYKEPIETTYKFDYFYLWKLIPSLTELQKMIGMSKFKEDVVNMVITCINSKMYSERIKNSSSADMFHTVICGKPGVGKTRVAGILANIYSAIGILPTNNVTYAKRSDFIGKYIGHTEHKTEELLKKAKGGVLFIDEAYSMGSKNKTDVFSKAAIDLLNQFLTENYEDTICIIAGYKTEIEENFFSINKGLERRFTQRFYIEDYTYNELYKMFVLNVKQKGWHISKLDPIDDEFFKTNIKDFKFFGGDMDTLFSKCKVIYNKRIFGKPLPKDEEYGTLTQTDLIEAHKLWMKNRNTTDDECVPEGLYI